MISRRVFLVTASAAALVAPGWTRAAGDAGRIKVRPVPLASVRLKPSIYATAVETNRKTLLALSPDRLLHNFHASAGLPPKGEVYGGWEARGVAGQTLGHYLTACSLMFAQTGDAAVRDRVAYIVAELARIQAAHGDGYVGGTIVERGGKDVDGKIIFEELRRGEVSSGGFDVNGGWVPLYVWHKVHAGLIDAERYGGLAAARPVMLGMAGYLATIIEGFDDAKLQTLLAAEHGGLNESYAETHALTGDPRWLAVAERIRHRAVLDPLTEGRNILPGLHANTQIPKLIGLARLHELTGDPRHAAAARFFHRTVIDRHSYVIGGNSDREHFGQPGAISTAITERTCESCNSYNMLKLTRHLYGWAPDARQFDYYERAHLNHIMAHQHPETGRFVYFMPLSAGARRTYSTAEDSFWCCVGSGIESHSKHGDSIWWRDRATLYVNLFIPSTLDWEGVKLDLDTRYPFGEEVVLTIGALDRALALRLPGWCADPRVTVNGKPAVFERRDGYAVLDRRWRKGDRVALTLPMALRAESTPDDPRMLAYFHGPVVLAADLGPADQAYDGLAPRWSALTRWPQLRAPIRPHIASRCRAPSPPRSPWCPISASTTGAPRSISRNSHPSNGRVRRRRSSPSSATGPRSTRAPSTISTWARCSPSATTAMPPTIATCFPSPGAARASSLGARAIGWSSTSPSRTARWCSACSIGGRRSRRISTSRSAAP